MGAHRSSRTQSSNSAPAQLNGNIRPTSIALALVTRAGVTVSLARRLVLAIPSIGLLVLAVFALYVGNASKGRPVEEGHYERWTASADSVQRGERPPSAMRTGEMEKTLIQLAKTENLAAAAASRFIVDIGSWVLLLAVVQLVLVAWLTRPKRS